jgi:hypothetical protein
MNQTDIIYNDLTRGQTQYGYIDQWIKPDEVVDLWPTLSPHHLPRNTTTPITRNTVTKPNPITTLRKRPHKPSSKQQRYNYSNTTTAVTATVTGTPPATNEPAWHNYLLATAVIIAATLIIAVLVVKRKLTVNHQQ